MGFLDELGGYLEKSALEKYQKMFSMAADYKLQEWWDENQYNDEVDQRIKDLAEKEMRRRGLSY